MRAIREFRGPTAWRLPALARAVGAVCSTAVMDLARSADGTPIAFERIGPGGAPVVIVGGAFSTADAGRPLAAALAALGIDGVVVDRRARGGSGDTRPYAPEREVEDLAAVLAAVGGGAVLGHSSGAVLGLLAAGAGVPMTHLFLSEPPFRFGVEAAAGDLPDRLQALVDGDDRGAAVTLFQREAVGLPEPVIEQIRSSPMFEGLVPLAQSTVYDAVLTASVETPTPAMTGVEVPVTILRGEPTFPMLVAAAERLAAAMPAAELVVVPESHDHGIDPPATARLVAARL